jgi:hypothetical protein
LNHEVLLKLKYSFVNHKAVKVGLNRLKSKEHNIGNIGRTVLNAYLRYVGTETDTAVSGAHTVVPMFDLLLSF